MAKKLHTGASYYCELSECLLIQRVLSQEQHMFRTVDNSITKCFQCASLTKIFSYFQTGKLDLFLQGTENVIQAVLSAFM